MRASVGLAVLVALAGATAAAGQTVTLDEGTYRVRLGGRDVGTETFIIRQSGAGQNATIVASGKSVIDGEAGSRTFEANLQMAGTTLRPAAYELRMQGGDVISGRVVGRRVTAKIVNQSAENVREYLVSEGAIIVDETVAHHYYFLARRMPEGGSRVPIVTPRESRQAWAEVTVDPPAPITVGAETRTARRFRVAVADGDERFFWADDQGRVLRLEVPARQLVVDRTAPPSE